MITLISSVTIISGLVYLISGFYVFLSWKRKKEFFLQVFTTFLLCIGMQMLFLTLGLAVFFNNQLMSSISWLMAHIFMLVGTGSLILLPIRIKLPTKEKLARKIIISYIAVGGLILLLNIPKIEIFTVADNIINWRVPGPSIAVIVVFTSVVSLFSIYVFVSKSFEMKDRLMKLRSIFLGTGILSFFIGGPMHNFVTDSAIALMATIFTILGLSLILAGIYIPIIFKQPRENFSETKI